MSKFSPAARYAVVNTVFNTKNRIFMIFDQNSGSVRGGVGMARNSTASLNFVQNMFSFITTENYLVKCNFITFFKIIFLFFARRFILSTSHIFPYV